MEKFTGQNINEILIVIHMIFTPKIAVIISLIYEYLIELPDTIIAFLKA